MRQRDLSTETRAEPLKQSFIDSHMAPVLSSRVERRRRELRSVEFVAHWGCLQVRIIRPTTRIKAIGTAPDVAALQPVTCHDAAFMERQLFGMGGRLSLMRSNGWAMPPRS